MHDAGDTNRPLEPGMVVTIEPGLYLPDENIGVRIEDDVLITTTGYRLLTARLPRTVAEIESIMAAARSPQLVNRSFARTPHMALKIKTDVKGAPSKKPGR